jgi:hypothetical protein
MHLHEQNIIIYCFTLTWGDGTCGVHLYSRVCCCCCVLAADPNFDLGDYEQLAYAPKLCSEELAIFKRWFLVIDSLSKCEDAINVVLSTLIVTLVAAILLLDTFVFC